MTIRTELRKKLMELCTLGSIAKEQIDELEGIRKSSAQADLDAVFGAASAQQLGDLRDAFASGRVIKGLFVDRLAKGAPKGCLLFHLFGWTSNEGLWNWSAGDGALLAATRTMRRWDDNSLTADFVLARLQCELTRREAIVVTLAAAASPAAAEVPASAALAG
jgi:hypothetical protein